MKKNALFLFKYIAFWLLVFIVARAIFLVYHHDKTNELSMLEIFKTFLFGLKLDISFTAYISAIFCLFFLINHWFSITNILKYFTYLLLFFTLLLTFGDVELYRAWNFRIDTTFFTYLKNPKEMTASVSSSPVFLLCICFAITYGGFIFLSKKILEPYPNNAILLTIKNKILLSVLTIIVAILMIIPIRGGIQQTPINQSSVYFSGKPFANHVAINVCWNFFDAMVTKKKFD